MPVSEAMTGGADPRGEPGLVRVLSYNIHECIGTDDRQDVDRIAEVLRAADPDIIGLQEVRSRFEQAPEEDHLDRLSAALGMQAISGPTLFRTGADYGNALLCRHPVEVLKRLDLSFPGREPRGALDVVMNLQAGRMRVIVTHLGLWPAERRFQVKRLVQALGNGAPLPVVLMGDLNEGLPLGRPARWLHRHFGRGPAPGTFPSALPLLALDRILVRPEQALLSLQVLKTPLTRVASDHLPLLAIITLR
jgi:endonuclease/exonuclease/phosphatase family metal-dependent hydrolase